MCLLRKMRLPDIDPAGRVSNGTGRDTHASNPYIPRMGVPAKRYAGMPPPGGAPTPRSADSRAYGSYDQSSVTPQPPLSARRHDEMSATDPPAMAGSLSARAHIEASSSMPRPSGGRGSSASASMGASPRSAALSDAALRMAQRKRLERLHDSYQTALSRETLLSEQYDKELVGLRESLQKIAVSQPVDRAVAEHNQSLRKRAKLERRVSGFEEKLNELDTYNGKLVDMISTSGARVEPQAPLPCLATSVLRPPPPSR